MSRRVGVGLSLLVLFLIWHGVVAEHLHDFVLIHGSLLLAHLINGLLNLGSVAMAAAGAVSIWRAWSDEEGKVNRVAAGSLARTLSLAAITGLLYFTVHTGGRLIGNVSSQLIPPTSDLDAGEFAWDEESAQLKYSGLIGSTFADRLAFYVEQHPGISALFISSQGGLIEVAEAAATIMRHHGLRVAVSSECLSACALMFALVPERSVSATAKVGFHAPFSFDSLGFFGYVSDVRSYKRAFLKAGFPETFVAKAIGTKATDMEVITGDELRTVHAAGSMADIYDLQMLDRSLSGVREHFSAFPDIAAAFAPSGPFLSALARGRALEEDPDLLTKATKEIGWLRSSGFLFVDALEAAELSAQFLQAFLRVLFDVRDADNTIAGPSPEDLMLKQIRLRAPQLVEALDYVTDAQSRELFNYIVGYNLRMEGIALCTHILFGGHYSAYVRELNKDYTLSVQRANPEQDIPHWEGMLSYAKGFGQGFKVAAAAKSAGTKNTIALDPKESYQGGFAAARKQLAKRFRWGRCLDNLRDSELFRNGEYRYLFLKTFFEEKQLGPKQAVPGDVTRPASRVVRRG